MSYWEDRYRRGGDSGDGSKGEIARWKAGTINWIAQGYKIAHMYDLGCGDCEVAALLTCQYTGYDPSESAINLCKRLSVLSSPVYHSGHPVHLSCDVIYHLVKDVDYDDYMNKLFSARIVIVYSTNTDDNSYHGQMKHIRHRFYTSHKALGPYALGCEIYPPESFYRRFPNRPTFKVFTI